MDGILAYTTSQNNFEAKVNDLVIQKLYQLKMEKKFSAFYSLFDQFSGEQTEDEPFMTWLIKKLGCRFNQFMQRYEQWQNQEFAESRGRRKMAPEVVKKVFDTNVENSISSTDGRNGRNMVKQSRQKFFEVYGQEMEHKDIQLETKTKRNRTVYAANRRIATCTIRAIQKKLEEDNVKISLAIIHETFLHYVPHR